LDLHSVTIGGRRYDVDTSVLSQRGRQGIGANKRTAEMTGGGAALGAIIGAIAGGGRGAAIGAGAGAGAGALTQILTKGSSIKVPVESVLTFKLDKPLRVVAAN
jgi:outer membrane lipoprotein SlyB